MNDTDRLKRGFIVERDVDDVLNAIEFILKQRQ